MQPPLTNGTILQNRYRIRKVLGQGGFGRTYVVEDLSRFNEICVLKEYNPAKGGTYALEKSKELFQREAQVLYQIKHPQIPQFLATFEEQKRIFLAQDFVYGKNYRSLLEDRLKEQKTFTEAEIVDFLMKMLPVLEYIHSKGIIHRDISPDNIILRQSKDPAECLPCLIDFGAVKQGVAEFATPEDAPQGTTVGKIGYSPMEQLQTGQVFPNSDIYALAVTAVVLLTGRKPQDLLDQNSMTWRWQQWVPALNPWVSKILSRMMSARPQNRFQSATEVLQALRSLSGLIDSSTEVKTPQVNKTTVRENKSTISKPVTTTSNSTVFRSTTNVKPATQLRPDRGGFLTNPIALLGLGIGVIFVFIGVPMILINALIPPKSPVINPVTPNPVNPIGVGSPVTIATPTTIQPQPITPIPPPNQGAIAITPNDRFFLAPGQRQIKQGTIVGNGAFYYEIEMQQGYNLSVSVNPPGVLLNILASNNQPLANSISSWSGPCPYTGKYYIQVLPKSGLSQTEFSLDVSVTQ